MSPLVKRAIEASGLGDVLPARLGGGLGPEHVARLRAADLLALGALADSVRADEVGPEVLIYTSEPTPETGDARAVAPPLVVLPHEADQFTGLELLREVAVARIVGAPGARVRVEWSKCGLELAQVALGFGANELAGRIVSKRGVPLGEGELLGVGKKSRHEAAELVKRKELAGFVRRAGRVPVFVSPDGGREPAPGEARVEESA